MATQYRTIVRDGLWDNNGVLPCCWDVPGHGMTALPPTLGMGLATAVVMAASSCWSACSATVTQEVRIPVFIWSLPPW